MGYYKQPDGIYGSEDFNNTHRFYVGAMRKQPGWAKATLEEAIEHGTKLVREKGEPVCIVEIVRILRPMETPIVVEKYGEGVAATRRRGRRL